MILISSRTFALSMLLAPLLCTAADLAFDPGYGTGMVLQREAPIRFAGRGTPGSEIELTLRGETRGSEVAADGSWEVKFDPLPAGGPHRVVASDGTATARLDDVLVGDVWLFSGQSNMQMGLDEVIGGPAALASASTEMPVRLLSVPKAAADTPQATVGAEWQSCTPESLRKFTAVGWFFAAHLRANPERAAVPLGLIDSSFGGTAIEAWTPKDTLPELPEGKLSGSMFGIAPGHLFNRMIAPLTAFPIKGAVWYQGEANAGAPEVYDELLENLIRQWRKQWDQPGLPFLVVQLPAFEGRMGGLDFGWLREAEDRACQRTDHAWLAVSYDTTDGFDLHPREKEEIGRRLSLLARKHVDGEKDLVAQGPRFESLQIEGARAVVNFDQALATRDGEVPKGFLLAGTDGEFFHARAELDGRRVVLEADGIDSPRAVRFAWGGLPDANLVNGDGLPALPFRSDDRAPDSLCFQPLPTTYRIEAPRYQLETGRGGSVAGLRVDGHQFLSNEGIGGTWVPGGFGPRSLPLVRVLGPRHLELADGSASLELACEDGGMNWTLANRAGEPVELHVELSPRVSVEHRDAVAELSRDGTRIRVEGFDRAEPGAKLVLKAPARGAATLRWTFPSR